MLTIEGMNDDFITECVVHMCECLGIEVPNIHIFVDDTIKPDGACYENSPNDFMVVLKSQDIGQMLVTLAHEMTHVKQFMKNNLSAHFDNKIPYMERWWEKEAYEMEVVITKSLIEYVKIKLDKLE
jgi:hypothetical protein